MRDLLIAGDTTNVGLYGIIFLGAAVIIVILLLLLLLRRRKKDDEEKTD